MKTYHFNFYAGGRFITHFSDKYENMRDAVYLEGDIDFFKIMTAYPDIDRIEIQQEG